MKMRKSKEGQFQVQNILKSNLLPGSNQIKSAPNVVQKCQIEEEKVCKACVSTSVYLLYFCTLALCSCTCMFLYLFLSIVLLFFYFSVLVLANLSTSFYLFYFCTFNWGSFILPYLYLCACTLLYDTHVFASVYTCVYTTQV